MCRPPRCRCRCVHRFDGSPPAHIAEAVADWRPEEMHRIVNEGVKMSGMPAWPASSRPDEVWAVVAFLTAIDRGMTAPD